MMHRTIKEIYIKVLTHGWKIGEYEVLGNGLLDIYLYNPLSSQQDREYLVKTENNLGKMLMPPCKGAKSLLVGQR